jgi:ApaG protein
MQTESPETIVINEADRKELWKTVSNLEKKAVQLLIEGQESKLEDAYQLLAKSVGLKNTDPFIDLALKYSASLQSQDIKECERLMNSIKEVGVPPHIAMLASKEYQLAQSIAAASEEEIEELEGPEEVDPGSNFSDTVTEKVRVKVSSFFDAEKSDPTNGKYMFWYKVGIYNEGSEPVQIVARMWEIEKCKGDKEVVRGAGIMSTQPIIPPGDVFTYQSACPLKVFPPKGKRVIGSMSGAYTMCKGNMGQHNFTVKVAKFNLILPDSVASM